jgi:NAD(P)H-dependent FMN reductase
MYIPIILGTAREGRQSEKAARFMLQKALEAGLESEIIDVRDYRLPATDSSKKSPQARKLAEKAERMDGLIIVSPEYNHGYPGELKMMLDMLFSAYAQKPVGICGVSSGAWGGVRMTEQLRLVCIALNLVPMGDAVHFPRVQELFDEQGQLLGKSQHVQAKRLIEKLIWHARALKSERESKLTD